jgi:hypothetical protein
MTWDPGGTRNNSRPAHLVRTGWALVRWVVLVGLTGLGLAAVVAIIVTGLVTLIRDSV